MALFGVRLFLSPTPSLGSILRTHRPPTAASADLTLWLIYSLLIPFSAAVEWGSSWPIRVQVKRLGLGTRGRENGSTPSVWETDLESTIIGKRRFFLVILLDQSAFCFYVSICNKRRFQVNAGERHLLFVFFFIFINIFADKWKIEFL